MGKNVESRKKKLRVLRGLWIKRKRLIIRVYLYESEMEIKQEREERVRNRVNSRKGNCENSQLAAMARALVSRRKSAHVPLHSWSSL